MDQFFVLIFILIKWLVVFDKIVAGGYMFIGILLHNLKIAIDYQFELGLPELAVYFSIEFLILRMRCMWRYCTICVNIEILDHSFQLRITITLGII